MQIEPVTQSDFEALGRVRQHPQVKQAVQGLAPLSGVKFPCRYRHAPSSGSCGGVAVARRHGKAAGMELRGRCNQGIIYIFRYE